MYTPTQVRVTPNQDKRLKKAISSRKATSIKLDLGAGETGDPEHLLMLTRSQIAKIERARLIGKPRVSIHFSKKQMQANIRHDGGFLGALAGIAAKVLPSLAKGLATGLVSGAVGKVMGDGLYLSKSGHRVKIEPVKGNGLYLTPYRRDGDGFPTGDGLFLKRGSEIRDGLGLILGPNSPFKNIPILNLLL